MAMEIEHDMEGPELQDLTKGPAVDMYREAANITNLALQGVISKLADGAVISDVCDFGDSLIEAACAKAFKNKKVEKGIAFPTCISVNECVAHYSPLKSESKVLKTGDVVKIDLGAHIDGYIAVAAHTAVVGELPTTGARADVMTAAYVAAEAALRTIKPGNTNTQVTEVIRRVAEAYGVSPIQGQLCHNMKQYVLDGPKVILTRGDDAEIKVEEVTFEANETWTVDIVFSTGEGKPRDSDTRATVHKRVLETNYSLKMKASRAIMNEVSKRYSTMAFSLRALGDESTARMGVVECTKHNVLQAFPVVYEKEGAEVAHFKFTVLLLPGGTLKVAGLNLPAYVQSTKAVPEDIKALLATESYTSKKTKAAKAKTGEEDVAMA